MCEEGTVMEAVVFGMIDACLLLSQLRFYGASEAQVHDPCAILPFFSLDCYVRLLRNFSSTSRLKDKADSRHESTALDGDDCSQLVQARAPPLLLCFLFKPIKNDIYASFGYR